MLAKTLLPALWVAVCGTAVAQAVSKPLAAASTATAASAPAGAASIAATSVPLAADKAAVQAARSGAPLAPAGAITIGTLSEVQAKELEADARRRLAQILNGGPGAAPGGQPTVSAVPVAPAASAPSRVKAASVLAVPSMAAAEPEPYVLLGIVGKPGSETAEIREPTGRVAVVERGQRVGQWIVSSITAEDIRLSWAGRTAKKKPAPTPVRLYVGNTFH